MKIPLKKTLKLLVAAAVPLICASAIASEAATYPTQPIKMVVGFSAGSATDVVARIVSQELSKQLGQPVVIDNKVGAGGSIAAESVAKAAPDGHTLLFVSSAIAVNPAVYPKLKFDVNKDLTPIALVGRVPIVLLVNNAVPVTNLKEFVAEAKKRPGVYNFGSSGQGGSIHMATELFALTAGIKLTHIPFRGNGHAASALLGGQVQMLMDTVINAVPHIKTGRVRALATTGEARSPLAPEVPTFSELGMSEFDSSVLFGIMGPANMPPKLVERINNEVSKALKSNEVSKRLVEGGGLTLAGGKPEEFQSVLVRELIMWKKVAKEASVTLQ